MRQPCQRRNAAVRLTPPAPPGRIVREFPYFRTLVLSYFRTRAMSVRPARTPRPAPWSSARATRRRTRWASSTTPTTWPGARSGARSSSARLYKPYAEVEKDGILLAVTEVNLRYHASARYDDLVRVTTWLDAVRSRAVGFAYLIERVEDGRVHHAPGDRAHRADAHRPRRPPARPAGRRDGRLSPPRPARPPDEDHPAPRRRRGPAGRLRPRRPAGVRAGPRPPCHARRAAARWPTAASGTRRTCAPPPPAATRPCRRRAAWVLANLRRAGGRPRCWQPLLAQPRTPPWRPWRRSRWGRSATRTAVPLLVPHAEPAGDRVARRRSWARRRTRWASCATRRAKDALQALLTFAPLQRARACARPWARRCWPSGGSRGPLPVERRGALAGLAGRRAALARRVRAGPARGARGHGGAVPQRARPRRHGALHGGAQPVGGHGGLVAHRRGRGAGRAVCAWSRATRRRSSASTPCAPLGSYRTERALRILTRRCGGGRDPYEVITAMESLQRMGTFAASAGRAAGRRGARHAPRPSSSARRRWRALGGVDPAAALRRAAAVENGRGWRLRAAAAAHLRRRTAPPGEHLLPRSWRPGRPRGLRRRWRRPWPRTPPSRSIRDAAAGRRCACAGRHRPHQRARRDWRGWRTPRRSPSSWTRTSARRRTR